LRNSRWRDLLLWDNIGLILSVLLVTGACSAPEKREAIAPTMVEEDEVRTYQIARADYQSVIKAGPQKVMRWYLLVPAYTKGKAFLGFRITRIMEERLKKGPLKVGDVITSINEMPIERPGQFQAIWAGLWKRTDLRVGIVRKGRRSKLVIPIVEHVDDATRLRPSD
jgi:type II secretory pathway component PulC